MPKFDITEEVGGRDQYEGEGRSLVRLCYSENRPAQWGWRARKGRAPLLAFVMGVVVIDVELDYTSKLWR
jgi:hypothetical protein